MKNTASSARGRAGWSWPRPFCSTALPARFWSARTTSAATGTSAGRGARLCLDAHDLVEADEPVQPTSRCPRSIRRIRTTSRRLAICGTTRGSLVCTTYVRFKTTVSACGSWAGETEQWRVRCQRRGRRRTPASLIVASGHHRDPLWPEFPGEFAGRIIHAQGLQNAGHARGKRVLVDRRRQSRLRHRRRSGRSMRQPRFSASAAAITSCRSFSSAGRSMPAANCFKSGGCRVWLQRRITAWLVQRRRWAARSATACRSPIIGCSKRIRSSIRNCSISSATVTFKCGPLSNRLQATGPLRRWPRRADRRDRLCDGLQGRRFPFLDRGLLMANDGRRGLFLNAFHPQHDACSSPA